MKAPSPGFHPGTSGAPQPAQPCPGALLQDSVPRGREGSRGSQDSPSPTHVGHDLEGVQQPEFACEATSRHVPCMLHGLRPAPTPAGREVVMLP